MSRGVYGGCRARIGEQGGGVTQKGHSRTLVNEGSVAIDSASGL